MHARLCDVRIAARPCTPLALGHKTCGVGASTTLGPVKLARRGSHRDVSPMTQDNLKVAGTRTPLVLIADSQEWTSLSLQSVLTSNGYEVVRAHTPFEALKQASAEPPDLALLSNNLPNGDSIALCAMLRAMPQFGAALPILILSPDRPARAQRVAALEAGAWDIVSYPIDVTELLPKLLVYVAAKREIDQARARALMDGATGLYNAAGLNQRAREIEALAHRNRQAVACVVLAPVVPPRPTAKPAMGETEEDVQLGQVMERLGRILKSVGRPSDAIGRLGPSEFAILAPDTDQEGAAKLAERLLREIRMADPDGGAPQILAGYDAVRDMREASQGTQGLLVHATTALRKRKEGLDGSWIYPFRPSRPSQS